MLSKPQIPQDAWKLLNELLLAANGYRIIMKLASDVSKHYKSNIIAGLDKYPLGGPTHASRVSDIFSQAQYLEFCIKAIQIFNSL